jgi:2-oxoisovalerate dehydrogenase E1 component
VPTSSAVQAPRPESPRRLGDQDRARKCDGIDREAIKDVDGSMTSQRHAPEPDLDPDRAYRAMLMIRRFEEAVARLYSGNEIPGFVHLAVGQEAVAVGVCSALDVRDIITSTHRGHAHMLAKGADPTAMFAELMGRATGTCGGMAGSMHIADPAIGVYGANGIVGAGLPIAVGAGLAVDTKKDNRVVVAFFGDGAVATGAFHEAVNLAALWRLPVLFCCENNGYAEFSATDDQHPATLSQRAVGYSLPYQQVDGNDVQAVYRTASAICARLRRGEGPAILEAWTNRVRGHYEGDPQRYRADPKNTNDPLDRTASVLLGQGISPAVLESIDTEITSDLHAGIGTARSAPWPDTGRLIELATIRQPAGGHPPGGHPPGARSGEQSRISQIIRQALDDALAEDGRVIVFGVDAGPAGNVFGLTRGLAERYPGRLRDTPISETAIVGAAVGAAMDGLRPVAELMYIDFVGVCLDQLMNQAAKLRFMTGGAVDVPLVLRTQYGVGRSSGSQHSQALEAILAHIPGLVVVMPSSPEDHYGLLRSAIESPDPVVVIENRLLYEKRGTMPKSNYRVPLGSARVARAGSDLTIVSWSHGLWTALEAAELAVSHGIDCEVIDLRTISPLDWPTVRSSLAKTSKLAIVSEEVTPFGVGAELAALAVDDGFCLLDAPIRRLSGRATPVPYSPPLEAEWLPNVDAILATIRALHAF